ncbi:MAG: hypothetical protein WCQ26_02425, partial [Pseudanabaena sp. ELA748]
KKYTGRSKNHKINHVSLTALFLIVLLITSQLVFLNPAYAIPDVCGTPGKDAPTVLSNIVNTYYPGTAATASTGANSIAIGAANTGAVTPITTGDLLLVIQMQDASIDSSNSSAYGDGVTGGNASGWTSLRTSGSYQYVVATSSVPLTGGTVNLSQPLAFTFTNANATSSDGQRRYQVIRVPQYASATISSTVTSYAWDGSVGGVVAMDVAGDLTFSGAGIIDVSGQGFRGGGGTNLGGDGTSGAASQNSSYVHNAPLVTGIGVGTAPTGANNYDGSKGEGIAGSPRYTRNGGFPPVTGVTDNVVEGYPQGSFSRGAPANAGGGGTDPNKGQNSANTGGGGGANAGAGGKGGDSWIDNNFSTQRQPFGGFGGTAVAPSVNSIFLGGGGGAATSNNSTTGNVPSGGGGGGMVIVRSGRVLGSGSISANGIQGVSPNGTDGGGGGGAGGTVLIQSVTASTPTISISAQGGAGLNSGYERHGPGGGGGGGYIAYQGFTPTTNVNPGAAGFMLTGAVGSSVSTDNYGAAPGVIGIVQSTTIPAAEVKPGALCLPSLTVTKTTSTPTVIKLPSVTATATYTITTTNPVTSPATSGNAINVAISDALPTNFTYASTASITPTGGATRTTVTDPTIGDTNPTWGSFTIPSGGQVQITFNVTIGAAATLGTYQNPATATYTDPIRVSPATTTTSSYIPASSTGEDVALVAVNPKLSLVKRLTAVNGVSITTSDNTGIDVADKWPTPATYLLGEISRNGVKPSDRLEYTIYFLSAGDTDITNVTICDLIPPFTTFISNTYGIDSGGNNLGIAFANSSTVIPTSPTSFLTSSYVDSDRGQFYPAGSLPPTTCKKPTTNAILTAADNTDGLVVVDVVKRTTAIVPVPADEKIPFATASGVPTNSYGFVRFQVTVK